MGTFETLVISCKEQIFNKGKENEQKMYKLVVTTYDDEFCVIYSRVPFEKGDVISCGLSADNEYRPRIKIIS